jgi:hypothetical protein
VKFEQGTLGFRCLAYLLRLQRIDRRFADRRQADIDRLQERGPAGAQLLGRLPHRCRYKVVEQS